MFIAKIHTQECLITCLVEVSSTAMAYFIKFILINTNIICISVYNSIYIYMYILVYICIYISMC